MLQSVLTALKPNGIFVSIDPIYYNPIIEIYRLLATEVRSPDECPLRYSDLKLVRSFFSDVGHREFWLLTQALFVKYFLFDRVHPNQQRYWKRMYTETERSLRWWTPLKRADSLLCRLPLLRWLSWNIVMWGRKT